MKKKSSATLMKRLRHTTFAICLLLACSIIGAKAPEWHLAFLRSYVGSRTAILTNEQGAGGSGFHIEASSGQTYLITNAHVCEISKTGSLNVAKEKGQPSISRKILQISDETDLCIMEPLPGVTGLSLGSMPSLGSTVASIGHPELAPITISKGEIVGEGETKVIAYLIDSEEAEKACNKPKNFVETVETFFGPIRVCGVRVDSFITSVQIYPGSSGSPLVNFFGNVVGVVFAGSRESGYGRVVKVDALKSFISPY